MENKKIKVVLTPDPEKSNLARGLDNGTIFRDEDGDLCLRVNGGFITLRAFWSYKFDSSSCFYNQKFVEVFGTLDVVVGPQVDADEDDSDDN